MTTMTEAFPIPPIERDCGSIIGDPVDPASQAKWDEEARIVTEARAKIEVLVFTSLLDRYVQGQLSLEWMCRYAARLVSRQPATYAERVLGQLIQRAIAEGPIPAPTKSEAEAAWSRLAVELVCFGRDEEKTGVTKVFPIVSNVFSEMGISVTETQIKRWYYASINP